MTEGTMNKYPSTVTGKTVEQKAEERAENKYHYKDKEIKSLEAIGYEKGFIDGYHECQKEHEWHYPSENDFPPFDVCVYVWSDGELWQGCYTQHESKVNVGDGKKEMRTFKWWEVGGKGGICSMQDTVDAWMPMSAIVPPKEIE